MWDNSNQKPYYYIIADQVNKKFGKQVSNDSIRRLIKKVKGLDDESASTKYRALVRKYNSKEEFFGQIAESISSLKLDIPKPRAAKKSSSGVEVVGILSDLHIGEVINTTYNQYNIAVARKRIFKFADDIIDVARNTDAKKINIISLGDNITGIIHDELVETSELNVIRQIIECAKITSEMYAYLAQEFDLEVYAVGGNHSRVSPEYKFKDAHWNFDYLVNYICSLICDKIPYTIAEDVMHLVKVLNTHLLITHGDVFRSVQIAQIERRAKDFIYGVERKYNVPVDAVITGHFHSVHIQDFSPNKLFICNGSVVGINEYALHSYDHIVHATQLILVINKDGIDHIKRSILNKD